MSAFGGLPNPLKVGSAIEAFLEIRPVLKEYGLDVDELNIWDLPELWVKISAILVKHNLMPTGK